MYCKGIQIQEDESDGTCGICRREKNACRVLIGKPEGNYHFGDLGIDGRVILKWILKK